MNKYKIIALLLVLAMSLCLFSACGDSATPGEKNDKLISETPDDLDIVDDELKKGAEEVTAITGATDPNGKVTDATGIVDKAGHRIYSTGLKDNYGKTIYTTGKKDSKGNILYTKNETDTFGDMIYYTGKYKDGKLELEQTNESPDYSSNETPTTKASAAKITTSTTVGVKKPSKESVDEAKCEYTKFFGGSGLDAFRDIIGCKDGGFVAAGISASKDGDYKGVSGEWETQHTSLVKYSSDGKVEWKYITGGNSQVNFNDVIELKDGTIVAAGQTAATSGDVVKTASTNSAFIVRLKADGTFMWKYVFPSDASSTGEYISSLAATPDGGFVAGGKAISESGFFTGTQKGGTKAFIFKFDKNGNIKWRKVLQGSKSNIISALAVNSDGDIYATCVTMSTDGDFSGIRFNKIRTENTVLLKLNKKGNLDWAEYLQGSGKSEFNTLAVTDDGGCVVGGTFTIYKRADGIYTMNYGKRDGYVLRYNSKGQVCWSRLIGGADDDSVLGIACIKGGFAVVGQSKSSTEDFQGYKVGGGSDGYILYLNDEGKTTATVRLNGVQDDSAMDVAVLSDGSIAIAGWTKSDDQAFNGSNAKKQYMGYVSRYTATMK
ncbi:pKD domain containing protein [Ruminococcus sp. CAG:488]|nr:pKD domain containing protein [Ruminococcus sp. CAG:488]